MENSTFAINLNNKLQEWEKSTLKFDYYDAMPLGSEVFIESVCGGSTFKHGELFWTDGVGYQMECAYFDMDMPPGTVYVENLKYMILPRRLVI